MIGKITALVLALVMCCAALAESDMFDVLISEARESLRTFGIEVSDELAAEVADVSRKFDEYEKKKYAEWGVQYTPPTLGETVYDLLIFSGAGDYDYDTGIWTPLSDKVYAFDAEVFDVEHMYTLFLQGMQSIIPDIVIDDISEEFILEGNFIFNDGLRMVSFTANGHPYSFTLASHYDWFNDKMLNYFGKVLKKEDCAFQLYLISEGWDQMLLLYYGTIENANALAALIEK